MPRPPRAIPYEQFKVSLPPELAAELRLRCFSPIHVYGAPKGAFSALFEEALRAYFTAHPLEEATNETTSEAQGSSSQDEHSGEPNHQT